MQVQKGGFNFLNMVLSFQGYFTQAAPLLDRINNNTAVSFSLKSNIVKYKIQQFFFALAFC